MEIHYPEKLEPEVRSLEKRISNEEVSSDESAPVRIKNQFRGVGDTKSSGKYGWRILWPVGQVILLILYLWSLYSQSDGGFGTLELLAIGFPICILFVGILPFLWLFLSPRWNVFRSVILFISISSLVALSLVATRDLVKTVAGPYLEAHLQAMVDSSEYEVTTEIYNEKGRPLGYVVSIKSKITSPNSIYAIDFDPEIVLPPVDTEQVKARYLREESFQFRPTSLSQRKITCEKLSNSRVCRFIFLPDLVQSEKNIKDPRSLDELCALSHPVTVLIDSFSCPYFAAPFVYDQDREESYASIVPPSGYDGVNWSVTTTKEQAPFWIYKYDSDFYQPDRWDSFFGEGGETLYVLIRKNFYVRGFKEGLTTITNPLGPVDVFPVKIFDKDIFGNAADLPACKIQGVIRGPFSSASTTERCRPHFDKYVEIDASLGKKKPVIVDRTGIVYFSDPQKEVSSLSVGAILAERDLFSVSKDIGNYTVFKQDVNSISGLFFSDWDTSQGGAGIRLSYYGGLKNSTQSLLYADGKILDPQNRNVVGGIKSVTFQSPAQARSFMEMLYREKGLRPNGNFPNEFISERGHFIYWIHKNVLFYMNIWNSPEDFRKQAISYYTGVFPPDFLPTP